MGRSQDIEWMTIFLQVLFYGMIAGLMVFFMSFFGFLGYRAGAGIINAVFGPRIEDISETNF